MKRTSLLLFAFVLLSITESMHAQTPPAPTQVYALASFYYVPDIRLTWRGDNSIGSSTYRVYRSAIDTTHFQMIATTYYSSYNDFQLLPGQTYYYYVTSVVVRDTTHYESSPSSIVNATAGSPGGGGKRHNNGTISGRVVDSLTGKAIFAVQISFYRVSSPGLPVQKILTDGSGHYRAALDTGAYIIYAQPPLTGGSSVPAYRPEWFRDAADPAHADPLRVEDTSRIVADFDLIKPGSSTSAAVNGVVRDSSGAPLRGATVVVMRSIQEMFSQSSSSDDLPGIGKESVEIDGIGHDEGVVWKGSTDSTGNYRANAAAGHSYILLAVKQGFVPQFFDHQTSPLMANAILLMKDTDGVNFDLSPTSPLAQFSVNGTVKDSSGVRIPSRVALIPVRHESAALPVLFGYTDSAGVYTINHVRGGSYLALALPFSKYAPAYYKAGAFGVSRWQLADTISVTGNGTGIDIGVVPIVNNGITHLEGKVRSEGYPCSGVNVFATSDDGSLVGYGLTDDSGFYSMEGLSSGRISIVGDAVGFQTSQSTVSIGGGKFSVGGIDLSLTPVSLTSVSSGQELPRGYVLNQNYPNPFNPSTSISYSIPVASTVSLKVYNVMGEEVATLVNGPAAAGDFETVWNGKDRTGLQVASGVYFLRLSATAAVGGRNFASVMKMVLLK